MNRLFAFVSALAAVAMPVAAAEIITEAPAGQSVKYYADMQTFDNTFGFMGEYHTTQSIIFAEDGSVYFPNMLMRNTMPAYVKGTYDRKANTITVEAGQQVFFFPNVKIPVGLYSLDAEGLAGSSETVLYDRPLVFDVLDDGILALRSSEEFPMFGICNSNNSEEVYALAKDLRFIPVENVDNNLTFFTSTYLSDNTTTTTTASGYRENDDIIWIQGLVPKYPSSWIKVERFGEDFIIKSFQVMKYMSTEDPIVAAALNTDNNAMFQMIVQVDPESLEMSIGNEIFRLGNIMPDGSGSFEIYQKYDNISLTPREFTSSKPAAPSFVRYSKPNSAGETEFVFDSFAKDTDGELLVTSQLYFRMYIDGAPYTFTTAQYRWLDEDMALVPYNFNNDNVFSIGGNDKERRWVYLRNLPAGTETIGVELVYLINGTEQTSDRLVYDIAAGKADTVLGIEDVIEDSDAPAVYYDMQGLRIEHPVAGRLYIRVAGDKATKVMMK